MVFTKQCNIDVRQNLTQKRQYFKKILHTVIQLKVDRLSHNRPLCHLRATVQLSPPEIIVVKCIDFPSSCAIVLAQVVSSEVLFYQE